MNNTSSAPAHAVGNGIEKEKEAIPIIPRIKARARALLLSPSLRKTQIASQQKITLVTAFKGSDQNEASILSQ